MSHVFSHLVHSQTILVPATNPSPETFLATPAPPAPPRNTSRGGALSQKLSQPNPPRRLGTHLPARDSARLHLAGIAKIDRAAPARHGTSQFLDPSPWHSGAFTIPKLQRSDNHAKWKVRLLSVSSPRCSLLSPPRSANRPDGWDVPPAAPWLGIDRVTQ